MDLRKIEEDVVTAIHKVVVDAAEHEPAIEDAAIQALEAAGAPPALAAAAGGLLSELLAHFHSQQEPIPDHNPVDPAEKKDLKAPGWPAST